MGTYGLKEVIRRWEQGRLTTEQAIGQLLLLLCAVEERLVALENRLSSGSIRSPNHTSKEKRRQGKSR